MRSFVRDALVWLGVVFLAPLWLLARLDRHDGWFAGCSECLSLLPGKPGVFLRRSFYRMTLAACATDCHIGFGTTFRAFQTQRFAQASTSAAAARSAP